MPTNNELEPTAEELEELIATNEAVDSFIERLEIVVERHVRAVKKELNEAESETQALAILARLSPELLPPYVLEQITRITKLYDLEMRHIKRRFAISDDDETIAFQMIKNENNRIRSEITSTMTMISSALALSAIGRNRKGVGITLPELEESYISTKLRQINTQTITILFGFRSGMEFKKGTELDQAEESKKKPSQSLFLYFGPRDAKNRPFCRDVLARGRLWTQAEVKELDKHPDAQLLPVSTFCGGYNCRHIWLHRNNRKN